MEVSLKSYMLNGLSTLSDGQEISTTEWQELKN